ncbi:hypothetical protein AB0D10_05450 [Kitasatospora sp. NPDC048545]|uniref:hypothetical protein n=1 Tax=Kitasatospora sp. NPDC048545 TaxID=3157208 RepID=UPI0033C7C5A1
MARCDLTDLPTDMCAHCLRHTDPDQEAARDRARLLATGRGWIAAQWPGTCEHCGERFEPGTAIRMDIPTGWRAECCAPTA